MKELTIRTYKQGETIHQPHFYVLNKGKNSGQPCKTQIWANCFLVISDDPMAVERAYWLCYALWQSKKFHFFLRGSVVEFITVREFKSVLERFTNAAISQEKLDKMAKAFNDIEKFERLTMLKLQTLNQLKQTLLQKLEAAHE